MEHLGSGALTGLSSKLYPKDVGGTLFTENPYIAEIALKTLFPKPSDSLKFISNILSKYSVSPITFNFTLHNNNQYMVFFIDYSGIRGNLEDLIGELKGNPHVVDVKFRVKRLKEKILDMFAQPTFGQGKYSALVLGADELGLVYEKIKEVYGSGGEAFLYYIGYTLGETSGDKYRGRKIDETFIREDILALQAYGWGVPEIVSIDLKKPEITIRFHELFESKYARRKTKSNCHFIRGYLAGLFTKFLGKKMFAIETKCVAKGDPYCEFLIRERIF